MDYKSLFISNRKISLLNKRFANHLFNKGNHLKSKQTLIYSYSLLIYVEARMFSIKRTMISMKSTMIFMESTMICMESIVHTSKSMHVSKMDGILIFKNILPVKMKHNGIKYKAEYPINNDEGCICDY